MDLPSSSADAYRSLLRAVFGSTLALAEPERRVSAQKRAPEIEWQSRWFAGEFGRQFTTTEGHPVEIVQFGTWNHAAGPDFTEVAVRVGGRLLAGALELDWDARDWERHGHALNVAYDDVVLHVFFAAPEEEVFHTRTSQHRLVPQVRLDAATVAPEPPSVSAEAKCGRCSFPLAALPAQRVLSLLEAAARFRLERKAQRLTRLIEARGVEEALFQELAACLGYRRNQQALMLLAQRLPLRLLRTHPAGVETLLFGAAGFLEVNVFEQAPPPTREYLRSLWETWWRWRPEFSAIPVPPWNFAGSRPHNHPQRRVAALAMLVAQWKPVRAAFEQSPTELTHTLRGLSHPFWDEHYTLLSPPAARPHALIGGSRVGEILANLAFPYWSLRPSSESWWKDYTALPAGQENEKTRRAALRLLGQREDAATFLKKRYQQQALIQLYDDFCLQDHSDCAQCRFPELLSHWPDVAENRDG